MAYGGTEIAYGDTEIAYGDTEIAYGDTEIAYGDTEIANAIAYGAMRCAAVHRKRTVTCGVRYTDRVCPVWY
eukprot:3935859-Rhodomonas_salina.1